MSILKYLSMYESTVNPRMTPSDVDASLDITDSPIKIDSSCVIDDKDVLSGHLGKYVDFDELELDYFSTKVSLGADKIQKDSVQWEWDDENLDNYIVFIKKREWDGESGDYVYEIIQVGDAEITNQNNPYLGVDRDAYSIPFVNSSDEFIRCVITSVGLYE